MEKSKSLSTEERRNAERIKALVYNALQEQEDTQESVVYEKKNKLYLYRWLKIIINKLLNNIRRMKNRVFSVWKNIVSRIKKKFQTQQIQDILEFFNFIFWHGIAGLFMVLMFLMFLSPDINYIQYMRQNIFLSIGIYLMGTGSFYYLFLDVNKALAETWKRKKQR